MLTTFRIALLRGLPLAPALVLVAFLPTRQPIVTWTSREPLARLWEEPVDPATANLFHGPWGGDQAPDPDATFTFLSPKPRGIDPGVVVIDSSGREWHVKQPTRDDIGTDGAADVVVSRALSAVGYHQPPVYFLPSFRTATGTAAEAAARTRPGGRFRLRVSPMKDMGTWSWQRNPFVGTRPYRGLLVILLLFDSTGLKDSNNTLYRVSIDGQVEHWYVVRDPGAALGDTGRPAPRGVAAERYERSRFIAAMRNGFVEFANRSSPQELFQQRITAGDVRWAGGLLARLTDRQWRDAFRAGGYAPDIADRFIRKIRMNIEEAQGIGGADGR
jgi:hypothetical protein